MKGIFTMFFSFHKICLIIFSSFACLFFCGCATEKLPASDSDVIKKYSREIKILMMPELNNAEERYNAADKLFNGVDFSFLRDQITIYKILGTGCKRNSSLGEGDMLQYEYTYRNKTISAKFWLDGNVVLRSDIIFRDASAPKEERIKRQTLPRGTKVDVQYKNK